MGISSTSTAGNAYAVQNGWYSSGGYWHYGSSGRDVTGWQKLYHGSNYSWHYFYSDGRMATGWLVYDGSWFYLAESGGQGIGFNESAYGAMRVGWQEIRHGGGAVDWYYFRGGDSGRMFTGWLDYGGHRYYLADEQVGESFYTISYGVMLTGKRQIGVFSYYFNEPVWDAYDIYYPTGAMLKRMILVFTGNDHALNILYIDEGGRIQQRSSFTFLSVSESQQDIGNQFDVEEFDTIDDLVAFLYDTYQVPVYSKSIEGIGWR